jgi:hypothetical protein
MRRRAKRLSRRRRLRHQRDEHRSYERHSALDALADVLAKRPAETLRWGTYEQAPRLPGTFFFFSNGLGIAGSILVSILLTLLLLYACSH